MILNEGVQRYQERVRAEKRAQILGAAEALMLNRGYDKTAVADIAKEAGVSLATFYKHFPTKSDILAALCDDILPDSVDKMDRPTQEDQPIRKALEQIATGYVEIILDQRMGKLFRLIITEVPHFPELGEIFYARIKQPVYARLYSYIRIKSDEGVIQVDDEEKAAAVIMSLINHALLLPPLFTNTNPVDTQTVDPGEVVHRAVDHFLKIYAV